MSDIDHRHTDEIVCPYCGHVFGDSWEYEEEGDFECYECGEEFYYYRDYQVTYISKKKSCEEKGKEHDYKLSREYDKHKEYVRNKDTRKLEWVEILPTEHIKVYIVV